MNLNFIKERRVQRQLFMVTLFLLGVVVIVSALRSRVPRELGDAIGTKTALAGTSQALLGPFPTSTAPTATASDIPSPTPTASQTPTFVPTRTRTPFVYFTLTERTPLARPTHTSTPRPRPTIRPTNTRPPYP